MVGRAACLLLVLAMALPASGHGATAARGIDTRVLLDDDGKTGYAYDTCTPEGVPPTCPAENGAADLLSLDAREAYDESGQPVLWFRLAYQGVEDTVAGRSFTMHLSVDGAAKTYTLATADGTHYTSSDFDRVLDPIPIGDGHPHAIDARLHPAALGWPVGTTLTGIFMESAKDAALGDRMPGGYYLQGQLTPIVPSDPPSNPPGAPPSTDPPTGGTYTIAGPAPLLTLTLEKQDTPASATLRLTGAAPGLAQTVSILNLNATPVVITPTSLVLDDGSSRSIQVQLDGSDSGLTRIVAVSDLGGRAELTVGLATPGTDNPPPANAANPQDPCVGSACPCPPAPCVDTTSKSKSSPAPLALVPLALAALSRRRA